MKTDETIRVIIACGGTGGHLFPGIAVAQALRKRGATTLLLVSRKTIDRHAEKAGNDMIVETIPSVASPGSISLRWGSFVMQLGAAIHRCHQIQKRFQPNVVLGMGGFTSAPAIIAASLSGIPTVIHESNAIPGKANRLVSRWVDAVAVGMKECAAFFPPSKVVFTGTPVRATMRTIPREEALEKLGLKPNRVAILVMGGSQGAHGLNLGMAQAIPKLSDLNRSIQFIHLCGDRDVDAMKKLYAAHRFASHVAEFLHEMDFAYSAASFVVGRAGASSLSETAHYGLASILVPYPQAAGHHQDFNACAFERAKAAIIVRETPSIGDDLAAAIRSLWLNELMLAQMAQAARRLSEPEAAERIADLLMAATVGAHETYQEFATKTQKTVTAIPS